MSARSLSVLHGGEPAATISEEADGRLGVEYADRSIPIPLSLSISLEGTSSKMLVGPWLAGIVPDSERLCRYWAVVSGAKSIRPFDLLSTKLGWDAPGSFQFVAPDLDEEFGLRQISKPETISRDEAGLWLAQIIAACDDSAPFTSQSVGAFSLAGARAKIGLRCEPGEMWKTSSGDLPTTHILKAGHPRIPSHAAVEHLCLTAATLCGLKASHSDFCNLNGIEAVLIERWDRANSNGYRTARMWGLIYLCPHSVAFVLLMGYI